MDRRLAAILAADVAGYSTLVGRDEEGTVRTLKGHLDALEPVIGLNRGRIVKFTGDGFLAEFPSVVAAVACAVAMQRQMAERNAAQDPVHRMDFRMGVHASDVVIDGDDILGDGVNIAARLQTVARPGGVVVSGRVQDDVADKMDLVFENLGEQRLKGIQRPVRVFAVPTGTVASAPPPEPERPAKPSVAVLAFDNLSPDGRQDYFAEGITEDIITALSRVPWLFVIARNSSFSYRGLAVDVRRIGRELGVRYVLEGSVRRAGDRLRVTGQLIDAETGGHLWADRFERGHDHVRRAVETCPNCVPAWGSSCLLNAMRGRAGIALEHCERALRLNPRDPLAYRVHYGMALAQIARRDWEGVLRSVERASLFENSVVSFRCYAIAALMLSGGEERAQALAARLLALDPAFRVSRYMERMLAPKVLDHGIYQPVAPALLAAGLPE